jgi:hypothetical protein
MAGGVGIDRSLMTNHAHILLRSGPSGLSKYMRRFLSGYAVSYNPVEAGERAREPGDWSR